MALDSLGYRVTGPNGVNDPNIAENVYSMAYELIAEYDAFQDNPWPVIYKEIDSKFPGSKFIFTSRDSGSWIQSQINHFGSSKTPMREWIYGVGCPVGNEDTYLERFQKHESDVLEYFKNRPNDLLVLDIIAGEGWSKLCPYLGRGTPNVPFPHINKATDRE